MVERASSVLLSMPSFGRYDIIGQYYRALCIKRSGNPEQAQSIFEGLFDKAPARLRLPLLLSIAGEYYDRADFQSAGSIYHEIVNLSAGPDPESLLLACRMIAQMRASGGDAHGAAEDLEKMAGTLKIVGATQPFSYFDYLNSMAYTPINVGRAPEAKRLCNIVLASPFAAAYPEWREIGEMAAARLRSGDRAHVVIRRAAEDDEPLQDGAVKIEKVSSIASRKESVRSKEASQIAGPGEGSGKADVLNYSKWMKRKARSRKQAAHLEPYPSRTLDDLTMAELKVRIGRAVFKPGLHKTHLVRMVQAIEAIDRDSSKSACVVTQPVDD